PRCTATFLVSRPPRSPPSTTRASSEAGPGEPIEPQRHEATKDSCRALCAFVSLQSAPGDASSRQRHVFISVTFSRACLAAPTPRASALPSPLASPRPSGLPPTAPVQERCMPHELFAVLVVFLSLITVVAASLLVLLPA